MSAEDSFLISLTFLYSFLLAMLLNSFTKIYVFFISPVFWYLGYTSNRTQDIVGCMLCLISLIGLCHYCTPVINTLFIHSLGSLHHTGWPHLHPRHNPPTSFNTHSLSDTALYVNLAWYCIILTMTFCHHPAGKDVSWAETLCDVHMWCIWTKMIAFLSHLSFSPTLQQIFWTSLWQWLLSSGIQSQIWGRYICDFSFCYFVIWDFLPSFSSVLCF